MNRMEIRIDLRRDGSHKERRKKIMKNTFLFLLAVLLCVSCSRTRKNENPGNYPYKPDTPAPAAHDGTFVSEHGSLRFSGDGKSVTTDFDEAFSGWTGLLQGEQTGTYVFLSGNLPPNGSFPVRYDIAHEMELTIGEKSVVIDMGIASEDGKTGHVGVNVVTPERIPMLFSGEDGFFSVVFQKEDE